jgi:hypothetical protein
MCPVRHAAPYTDTACALLSEYMAVPTSLRIPHQPALQNPMHPMVNHTYPIMQEISMNTGVMY